MYALFRSELQRLAPDFQSARFLLAVSGGQDSCVLAHLFAKENLSFDIAHCNFNLRGNESVEDMKLVKNMPLISNQKVFIKEFDTYKIQQNSGKSIEMVARELRYKWFEEIGKDYDYIVTAQHANDNAETLLMNLLRGTGLRGLCAIPEKNGKIIRPLLKFNLSEIKNSALENKISFRTDSSNLTDDFLRNKIRHHIIPELEKINSQTISTFSHNCETFSQQYRFFETQMQLYREKLLKQTENGFSIDINELKKEKNATLILFEILTPFGFNMEDIISLFTSFDSISGKRFFSKTHIINKDRNQLFLEEINKIIDKETIINSIDELQNSGFSVDLFGSDKEMVFENNPNILYVDAEKLKFPVTIRSWKEGDFFYPYGLNGKKKVSDFFTDYKVSILEKQKIKLLFSDDKLLWIIGFRADERGKIDAKTKKYYKITKL